MNEGEKQTEKDEGLKVIFFTAECRGCRETRFADELSEKQTVLRLLLPSHRVILSQTSSFLEKFVRLYFLASSKNCRTSFSVYWMKEVDDEGRNFKCSNMKYV